MPLNTGVVNIHKVKGKRPAFDVYIGRALQYTEFTQNSIWHNPYRRSHYFSDEDFHKHCLEDYESFIRIAIASKPEKYNLESLRGKRLGCWCVTTDQIYPLKCHGQILLKLLKESDA